MATGTAANASPDALALAKDLASQSEEDAVRKWEQSETDEAVLDEVEKYRRAIRAVAEKLESLDVDGRLDQGQTPAVKSGLREIPIDEVDPSEWQVPPHCIPIHADVTTYDWRPLYECQQFDVIMMDPPWVLATSNPTRGVALGYGQLTNKDILALPIPKLQSDGLLFMWVINSSYDFAITLFNKWGYRIVDEVVWVKLTVNRRLAKSHGFYLQHAKEVCLVGLKGKGPRRLRENVGNDIILSERRGQSQKPEEIYELIEELVPGGTYLEIFARKNNLRNFWVSVGNETCGTLKIEQSPAPLKTKQ